MQFKYIILKIANVELYYDAVHFSLQEHPDLFNDVLNVLALWVDHTHVYCDTDKGLCYCLGGLFPF